jgi:hypothetical protein
VEGSSYEGTLGAPLDLLLSSKKKFEDVSDEKFEKLRNVGTFTFTTHTLTSNTAFRKLKRTKRVVKPSEMPLFAAAVVVLKLIPIPISTRMMMYMHYQL